ncbi:MAG: HlyC/CorC family transporter [Myxococcales bacterium]|nr:HlyC/CorC family transporter [Myxococcales bacterium]
MDYVLFVGLLLVSCFFSGSETAMFSIGKVAQTRLQQSDRPADRLITRLLASPRNLLITVLLGNELTNVALSIVSATITARLLEDLPLVQQSLLSAAMVVPLLLLFGEITPKTISALRPELVARVFVRPLSAFAWLTSPLRAFLRRFTDTVVRLLGGKPEAPPGQIDEAELRTLVDVGAAEGFVEAQERVLIHNVLDFDDLTVADVMRPWSQVFTLNVGTPVQDALDALVTHRFSRVPVWSETGTRVTGILYAKDLLPIRWGGREPQALRRLLRRPVFTLRQRPANELLDELRALRTHMAVVVDEFGRAIGLITMEDLLEELFGPIEDQGPAGRRGSGGA